MKHPLLFLSLALFAALASRASIVTQSNNVYSSFPPAATFEGKADAPAIPSRYIPYGTYTVGRSSEPEITRVTSNLLGVVASCFDGYWERLNAWAGLVPTNDYAYGEHWETDTLRILDKLNATNRTIVSISGSSTNNLDKTIFDSIRGVDDFSVGNFKSKGWWSGYASSMYTPYRDDPPLPTEWTNYQANAFRNYVTNSWQFNADSWQQVWHTFAMFRDDALFVPQNAEGEDDLYWRRANIARFLGMESDNHLYGAAGSDYNDAVANLLDSITNQWESGYASNVVSMLGREMGLAQSDVADHFTNNTTRLDWKRLGTVCQFLRQADATYGGRNIDSSAVLSNFEYSTVRSLSSTSQPMTVTFSYSLPLAGSDSVLATSSENLDSIAGQPWTTAASSISSKTNALGLSYPKALADSDRYEATAQIISDGYLSTISFKEFRESLTSVLTNCITNYNASRGYIQPGTYHAYVSGGFHDDDFSFRVLTVRIDTNSVYYGGFLPKGDRPDAFNGFRFCLPENQVKIGCRFYRNVSLNASAQYTKAEYIHTSMPETPQDIYRWDHGDYIRWDMHAWCCLLAAINDTNVVDVAKSDSDMRWDELSKAGTGARRAFVYTNSLYATTRDAAGRARFDIADIVNAEVRSEFERLAGTNVEAVARRNLTINPSVETNLYEKLNEKYQATNQIWQITYVNRIKEAAGNMQIYFHLDCTIGYDEIGVPTVSLNTFEENNKIYYIQYSTVGPHYTLDEVEGVGYVVGTVHASLDHDPISSRDESRPPVRVDGYINTVPYIRWRFKNLGEP